MGQASSGAIIKTRRGSTLRAKSERPLKVDVKDVSSHTVLHNIRDLSTEVQLLGDNPAAHGVLSSIWLGTIPNNIRVAVKLFTPGFTAYDDFLREALVWSWGMHHENVMPLLGVARLGKRVALVSPWMPEGDLRKYFRTYPDANPVVLMADIARGLAHLHSLGIVYGNLRPSTILVSEMGRAYLSSFVFAHAVDGPKDPYAGTKFLYRRTSCPECLSSDPLPPRVDQTLSFEDDVFAFGDTVMEALEFGRSYTQYVGVMERSADRPGVASDSLRDNLWLLINRCRMGDRTQRPTMAEVARQMVELTEATISSHSTPAASSRFLKNISAEIKNLSEHPIAAGGYCDLYLGQRRGSEGVALKLVRFFQGSTDTDKDRARRRFFSEARIWAELDHPRILEFYGICEYGTTSLFMVSPFCRNGNIMHYLTSIAPDADRRRLLIEAAEGLLYLHTRQPHIIHGDLKGANILISDAGCAVLADFGLSRISIEETTTMLQGAGSPRWMAPELISAGDQETGPLKSPKTDIYAFGHTMLEVLSHCKPFFHLKEDLHVIVDLLHKKRSPRPTGPIADIWLDDSTWAYCQTCTAINPDDRPDIDVVITDIRQLFT